MSNSINQVLLSGTLARDPELKPAGTTTVCTFSIAVGESRKAATGQWVSETSWILCKCWGKVAEKAGAELKRGAKAFVEGRLVVESWENKNGDKKTQTVVVADRVVSLATARQWAAEQEPEPADAVEAGSRF